MWTGIPNPIWCVIMIITFTIVVGVASRNGDTRRTGDERVVKRAVCMCDNAQN